MASRFEELKILNELKQNNDLSQRQLAKKIDLSLGMTNYFLKNLLKKGYLKFKRLNRKKIQYLLTPKGFSMGLKYELYLLQRNIQNYGEMKKVILGGLKKIVDDGYKNIYIASSEEWWDLFYVAVRYYDIKLKNYIGATGSEFLDIKVLTLSEVLKKMDKESECIILLSSNGEKMKIPGEVKVYQWI